MTVLQSWLVFGIPGLVLAAALFLGRSQRRAILGYLVLVDLVVAFLFIPRDTISAAAVGLIAFVLVANGRGTKLDEQAMEHHENRKRFTTDPSHA